MRRRALVDKYARALEQLPGIVPFDHIGVENLVTVAADAPAACDLIMALLADSNWAIGLGIDACASEIDIKHVAEPPARQRAGTVAVRVPANPTAESDIAASFALLAFVLSKRSIEGREATSLMRSGLNQNEAAAELGITKQAISQRLQAAGWHAELAGWQLAVHLIERAHES